MLLYNLAQQMSNQIYKLQYNMEAHHSSSELLAQSTMYLVSLGTGVSSEQGSHFLALSYLSLTVFSEKGTQPGK